MLQHFVLTRFSYRGARVNTADDPLDMRRLRRRMRLFEAITAPSLAAQTDRGFTWVVIVDPALPGEFRVRLHSLTAAHPNLRIVEYRVDDDVESLEWLDRLLPDSRARWVLTTNLDDDDALARGFVEAAQREAHQVAEQSRPLTIFGVESARHWQMIPRRNFEMGSVERWRRTLPVSAGLSLLCDRHALDLSVLAVTHRDASRYGSATLPDDLPRFRRDRIERVNRIIERELDADAVTSIYRPFRSPAAVALMVSHLDNIQAGRSFGSSRHTRIDIAPVLDDFGIDPAQARTVAADHRLGLHNSVAQARRVYRADAWALDHPSIVQRFRLAWSSGRRVLLGLNAPSHRVSALEPAHAPARH